MYVKDNNNNNKLNTTTAIEIGKDYLSFHYQGLYVNSPYLDLRVRARDHPLSADDVLCEHQRCNQNSEESNKNRNS